MTKEALTVFNNFFYLFGYFSAIPEKVFFEDEAATKEFCEVLQRSIDTGVDETIEKYGTDPTYGTMPHSGVFID